MEKILIGRKETANLPTFGLIGKTVKIDSGAYTSSIDIERIRREGDVLYVLFDKENDEIEFKDYKVKVIKSSNGLAQERYIIKGKIHLGNKIYNTQFSLTDRSGMRYPILIGRRLLNKKFIIDTSKAYLLEEPTDSAT